MDVIISILSWDDDLKWDDNFPSFFGNRINSMLLDLNMDGDGFANFSPALGGFFVYSSEARTCIGNLHDKEEKYRTLTRKRICHHIAKKNLDFIDFRKNNNKDAILNGLKDKILNVEALLESTQPTIVTQSEMENALLEYLL